MTAPFGPFESPTRDLDAQERVSLEGLERVQGRIAAGVSRVDAVAAEPEAVRAEIEEMLEALDRVESFAEAPSVEFATKLEARFLGAVDDARTEAQARRHRRWLGVSLMRLAAVLGAVVLALGVGSFAAVEASGTAIPGDVLYPVKEASENVRLFFARGDGVTRLRLAQLARRQAELEAAVQRDAAPRVVLRLETKVALTTNELVRGARRFAVSGNTAPAQASLAAVTELHDRVEALTGLDRQPEVRRLLRRMALFLEGQERQLQAIASGPAPVAPAAAPSVTPGF